MLRSKQDEIVTGVVGTTLDGQLGRLLGEVALGQRFE